MSRRTIYQETTAVGMKFPDILWNVAQRVFGADQRPEYVIHVQSTSSTMRDFWADVHVYRSSTNPGISLDFAGRPMPTPTLAIQCAAWEALASLRHLIPEMGSRRAFRYYPSRPIIGGVTTIDSTQEEQDVAVIHLVRYIAALNDLFTQVVDTLALTRHAVSHAQAIARSTPATLTPSLPSGESPLPGIPVRPRRPPTWTADHSDLLNSLLPAARPEPRRRHSHVPRNSPATSEEGSPRAEVNSTPAVLPDINLTAPD